MTLQEWNKTHPIGSIVTIRSPFGELQGRELVTVSEAFLNDQGSPTVMVVGISQGVVVHLQEGLSHASTR